MQTHQLVLMIANLAGTFVFALSGALAATRRQLDLFGVLVLAFAAANAGGIARDLLIGAVPPVAVSDWRYLAVAMAAGVVTFRWAHLIERLHYPVRMFDAAGLALFTVTGAHKALAFGLHPVMAALLGMLTGIGGGMMRDLLLADVPMVLRADLYAVAALVGAVIVVSGAALGLSTVAVMSVGAAACFVLRMLAVRRGWHLPTAASARIAGAEDKSRRP
ncbi:trimeric intracellular cation channel family protein [Dyella sp.]|jgi:uncharacterized membrane protein YeiH|uniref:trimeric intracellular cation channel family protein n=1 Tax=Dyella sp. TaxID=1869338 RepID=UPI002D770403|nr:trimeric intracellular cation channel family protein [Dyella sp.]HET6431770.1 trimeric intracellular cation channel family protein [Dyella sp.]